MPRIDLSRFLLIFLAITFLWACGPKNYPGEPAWIKTPPQGCVSALSDEGHLGEALRQAQENALLGYAQSFLNINIQESPLVGEPGSGEPGVLAIHEKLKDTDIAALWSTGVDHERVVAALACPLNSAGMNSPVPKWVRLTPFFDNEICALGVSEAGSKDEDRSARDGVTAVAHLLSGRSQSTTMEDGKTLIILYKPSVVAPEAVEGIRFRRVETWRDENGVGPGPSGTVYSLICAPLPPIR